MYLPMPLTFSPCTGMAETLKSGGGGGGKMRTVTVVSLLQYQKFSNPLSNDASRCFYA